MKQFRWVVMSWVCVLLTSCSLNFLQPNEAQPYMQKKMLMQRDMFLVESKQSSQLSGSLFWVFSLPQQSYYNNYVNATLPTFAMYHSEKQKWQRWQGSLLSTWARVVGVIRKGTKFHIIDVTPRGSYYKDYWVSLRLDDGEFAGQVAYYGNPKELVPELYPAS